MLKCALTGEIPQSPVITPNGRVFERGAIEQYLKTNTLCPIDGVPLTTKDLIPLKITTSDSYPAEIRTSSFVQLLASLQAEYDSVQTELHSLRTKLAATQRELAQALYENDAARRVIARLYTIIQKGEGHVENIEPTLEINEPSAPDLREFFLNNARHFSSLRKHDKTGPNRVDLSLSLSNTYINSQNFAIGSGLPDDSILTAIDSEPSQIILVGSSSGTILAFDRLQHQVVSLVQAHHSPIICIDSTSDRSRTLSADNTGVIALWERNDSNSSSVLTKPYLIKDLKTPIVGIQWHPAYQHIFVCIQNGQLLMLDSNTLEPVSSTESAGYEYSTGALHCDGYIIAAGLAQPDAETGAGTVEIWDACFEGLIKSIPLLSPPIDIKFSPAGKLLAVAGINYVRLLLMQDPSRYLDIKTDGEIHGITFDEAGYMLLAVGEEQSTLYHLNITSTEISAEKKAVLPLAGESAKVGSNGTFIVFVNGTNDLQLVLPENAAAN